MLITKKEKFRTDEKVLIECDFKISPKCKNQFLKLYKNVVLCRANNGGKDRCSYCFNSITKTGAQNYNFKYQKNENFFEEIDTELKAYLLGWVAGDGSLNKNGLRLSVHKKDKEIIDLFIKALSPDSKSKFREYDNTVNLTISSTKIVEDLCRHLCIGLGKKSHKIILPQLSDELIWHYIRGLFDSDGHVANPLTAKATLPVCSYCSMSTQILIQIIELCNKYSIKCSNCGPQLLFKGHNANKFMSKLYDCSSYFLKRKKDFYIEWSTWIPRKGTEHRPPKIRDPVTINLTGLPWFKKRENAKLLYT